MFYPDLTFPPINLHNLPYQEVVVVKTEGNHVRTTIVFRIDSEDEIDKLLKIRKKN